RRGHGPDRADPHRTRGSDREAHERSMTGRSSMRLTEVIALCTLALVFASCADVRAVSRTTPTTTASAPRIANPWQASGIGSPGPLTADDGGTVMLTSDRVVALAPGGGVQWKARVSHLGIQYPVIDRDLVVVSTLVEHDNRREGVFVALD